MNNKDNQQADFHVELSDTELEHVKRYAASHGLTAEDAASQLVSLRIQKVLQRKTHRSPARNVLAFRKNR